MTQFRLYWKYRKSASSEDQEDLVNELVKEFENAELADGKPLEKGFEQDIALIGSYLLIHHPDTLASIYQILKERGEIHQIKITGSESLNPVFQLSTGDGTNISAEGDVTIIEADEVTLAHPNDTDSLREFQREYEERIIDDLGEVRDEEDGQ